MKINSLSRQNFCAKPCRQTKDFLYEMEENNINTKPITDVMNRIYVGDSVHTSIAPEGNIVVSIYHKKGDLIKNLIKLQDDLTVDTETLKLKNPKEFADKFLSSLLIAENARLNRQEIKDKVNFNLTEK